MSPRKKKIAGYTAATAGFAGVNAALYGIMGHDSFTPVHPVHLIAASKIANDTFPHIKRYLWKHYMKPSEPAVTIRSNRYAKKNIKESDDDIMKNVKKEFRDNGHWFWKGRLNVNNNVKAVYRNNSNKHAVRDVYRKVKGKEPPPKLFRICDDSRCVNPNHHLGTKKRVLRPKEND
jgi:hypothetical protein